MKPLRALVLASALIALVAAGCGDDDDTVSSGDGGREIHVTMDDLAFDPSAIDVQAGETVTFVLENQDDIEHEAVIGDEAAQEAHEAEMNPGEAEDQGDESDDQGGDDGGDDGGMDMGHGQKAAMGDDADAVSVAPGETGELTYTFG